MTEHNDESTENSRQLAQQQAKAENNHRRQTELIVSLTLGTSLALSIS